MKRGARGARCPLGITPALLVPKIMCFSMAGKGGVVSKQFYIINHHNVSSCLITR